MQSGSFPNDGAAERVLRRAEISRLTRNLKSKLAMASLKTQQSAEASTQQSRPISGPSLSGTYLSRPSQTEFSGSAEESFPRKRAKTMDSRAVLSAPLAIRGVQTEPRQPLHAQRRIPRSVSQGGFYGSPLKTVIDQRSDALLGTGSPLLHQTAVQPVSQKLPSQLPQPEKESVAYKAETLPPMPSTPPQAPRAEASSFRTPTRTPANQDSERDRDGASLLLYLATSPGRPGAPQTPRTPDFNLNDYLHFYSPSPGRPGGGPPGSASAPLAGPGGTPKRFVDRFGSLSRFNAVPSGDLFANIRPATIDNSP